MSGLLLYVHLRRHFGCRLVLYGLLSRLVLSLIFLSFLTSESACINFIFIVLHESSGFFIFLCRGHYVALDGNLRRVCRVFHVGCIDLSILLLSVYFTRIGMRRSCRTVGAGNLYFAGDECGSGVGFSIVGKTRFHFHFLNDWCCGASTSRGGSRVCRPNRAGWASSND